MRECGQLLIGVESDDLDPVGVENRFQVMVPAGAGPQLRRNDVGNEHPGVVEDRFEDPQPLATGEVTEWTRVEYMGV